MVKRVMESTSGGVAGIGQLPTFELPAAGGGTVRSWDFKSRRPLVVWFAGASPTAGALASAVVREPELRREGAELLLILRAPLDRAEQIKLNAGLRGPVLADPDGRVHDLVHADGSLQLVTDRHGTIYWEAPVTGGRPDFDEALSWLGYIDILEPECGTCVPAWPPAEEM